jgi:1-acyl-sn-glycerol-3-phosphate acyltransferase
LSPAYRILKLFLYTFFRVFYGLEVFGLENIPKEGGFIMAANHASYLDPPVIGGVSTRRVRFMAREGLFKIPLFRSFIKIFSFPIKRGRPHPSAIKESVQRLRQGEMIVMFPEGGRSVDGSLLEAKRGLSVISAISRTPVVPTFIKGTEKALPVGAKLPRPSKITVTFGPPLQMQNEETEKQYQERLTRDIIKEIENLKAKAHGKKSPKSKPSSL